MSLESRLAQEPPEVDHPMKTSSMAGQDTNEWLRDSYKLVLYSFTVLPAAGLPVHVLARLFVISTGMK